MQVRKRQQCLVCHYYAFNSIRMGGNFLVSGLMAERSQ